MNLNGTRVQFLGSEKGNGTTLAGIHNTSGVDMHPVGTRGEIYIKNVDFVDLL